ncbi:hypothetical protein cauri_1985 [Corynebacterium aurimucosum ATCC 700975]|uniref:Hint domain-containing protein n=3 Tax=Corynebacterium aurimucosum TaxID=169292 RepID=C3PIC4_CORA7|nr:phage minor capsid protein [Corynebacterium aurimucosum]ACP33578.1 hypothetical protein cauri_1985 [Corynebacterium aurimucosum ATCC 700975]QQU92309.1 minor capsid protein [Corynebacterium aurimucosum]
MADSKDRQAARLVRLYEDAEILILRELSAAIKHGTYEDVNRLLYRDAEVRKLLERARRILTAAGAKTTSMVEELAVAEFKAAMLGVLEDVGRSAEAIPTVAALSAVQVAATGASQAIASTHLRVVREVSDVYRSITAQTVQSSIIAGADHRAAMRHALNQYADRGITAFVDRAGRKWALDSYVDMSVRTMRNQATQEGHLSGYEQAGVELVRASWHTASAPQCYPFQNQLLAISGGAGVREMVDPATGEQVTVHVKDTLRGAISKGYHHPNAILGGEQTIDTFAGTVGASKGTYFGPAFTIRTAKGHKATVSPEHPILTSRGWRTAESIRVGDHLFNTVESDRTVPVIGGEPKLEEMPATVEDEFASLKRYGTSTSATTSGYHFNDDRQFLKGEVDVVMADDCLLPVPDTKIVKETGEVRFVWPDMGRGEAVGHSGLHSLLHGVATPVGGALPQGDAFLLEASPNGGAANPKLGANLLAAEAGFVQVDNFGDVDVAPGLDGRETGSLEALSYRRPGDSEHPSDVCAAVPGVVESDEVVSVEKFIFRGHAYDFQTELGFYALNGIVVHNCRHRDTAYTPGDPTPQVPMDSPAENKRKYKATQQQRYMERQLRRWKRREAVALSPLDRDTARAKTKGWNRRIREHVNNHEHLTRWSHRERPRS